MKNEIKNVFTIYSTFIKLRIWEASHGSKNKHITALHSFIKNPSSLSFAQWQALECRFLLHLARGGDGLTPWKGRWGQAKIQIDFHFIILYIEYRIRRHLNQVWHSEMYHFLIHPDISPISYLTPALVYRSKIVVRISQGFPLWGARGPPSPPRQEFGQFLGRPPHDHQLIFQQLTLWYTSQKMPKKSGPPPQSHCGKPCTTC